MSTTQLQPIIKYGSICNLLMTRILKLEIKGFKSFAKHTELVFGETFNTVIGPNGSGKSNVMDAICFVLGKSGAKSMRVEKSSNLIFNGGKTKKPFSSAEVSIYFDNSEEEFPINSKEIKVSRIIKQDGTSTYKLNDKKVTRTELLNVFAKANIDPDGYNIIMQGDIIKMIDMSPTDRRKILEEIAGISIYDEKKDKALREMEKVEGHIKETEVVLAERKTHLDELKIERDEAEKFLELDQRSKELKFTLLDREIKTILKNEEKNFSKKEHLENKKLDIKKKIEHKNSEIQNSKLKIKQINEEIESKGSAKESDINKRIEELKINIEKNKNRLDICKQEIEKIDERDISLKNSKTEIEGKIDILSKEISELQKQKKQTFDYIEKNKKDINEFNKKNNINDLSDIEFEIDHLDEKIEKISNEINQIRQEQQDTLREKDKIEIQMSNFDENKKRIEKIKEKNKEEFERLKTIRKEFKEKTLTLNKKLNEDSSISAQLHNARQKMVSLEKDLAKAEAKKNIASAQIAQDRAMKHILKQKGKREGIIGLVSELGNVKKEYSQALETAAGGRLKNIVVETDNIAKDLISELKRLKLGSATFLPLNKIKYPNTDVSQTILNTQGVVGRAYDLINFDPKLEKIFKYIFGSTIVVDSITTAQKVGIGKVRMVTLEGDIVEGSGAMRGGFRRKTAGTGFAEKESQEKAETLEKDISNTRTIISNLEKRKQDSEEEIVFLRQKKAELEGEIIKIEKSLHVEEDFDFDEGKKKELEEKYDDLDDKLDEITMKISEKNRELATLKTKKQELKNKVLNIKDPKKLAELNALKSKEEELRDKIKDIDNKIKNNRLQIDNILTPELKNIQKIETNQVKEKSMFSEEIENLNETNKEMQTELTEKNKIAEDFLKKFKNLINKRNELENEITELEKERDNFTEELRASEIELNTLSLNLASVKGTISGLEEQKEQLNINLDKKEEEDIIKEYDEISNKGLKTKLSKLENDIKNLGTVNMKALDIYEDIKDKFDNLILKKEKLESEKEEILLIMNEIETKKRDEFIKTYEVVQEKFKRLFSELISKGDAHLELEDKNDPFNGGMLIKVRITGNKFLDIRSLSGGEKTMVALAFIFAIQEFRPASFYIMDEVDAALDKKNAEKLGQLVRKYGHEAQYVVISHNDGVIKQADYLFGVSMSENISKVVSLRV